MDSGAWWAIVHGVTKGQTQLRTCTHDTLGNDYYLLFIPTIPFFHFYLSFYLQILCVCVCTCACVHVCNMMAFWKSNVDRRDNWGVSTMTNILKCSKFYNITSTYSMCSKLKVKINVNFHIIKF